jgi:2-polyprenyl-6-methoxyphenol hydroxylase-like FAD-dependent oxidoreductase
MLQTQSTLYSVLPHRAQSACQAIEDAEALGAFLKETTTDGVSETLRRVFRVRYKRASRAQAASHATNLKNGEGNAEQAVAVVRLWDYYGAEKWEKEHPEDVLTEQEVANLLNQLSA